MSSTIYHFEYQTSGSPSCWTDFYSTEKSIGYNSIEEARNAAYKFEIDYYNEQNKEYVPNSSNYPNTANTRVVQYTDNDFEVVPIERIEI